jgi:glycogen synthase
MSIEATRVSPRKVLMTADAVSGVWTYALELCAGVAASDTQVVLATMGPEPTQRQREAVARLPHVTLETSDFRLEWMPDPWDDLDLAGEWLLDLAEVHRPDLIHLNGYVHATLPWTAPVLVVAHSCVWSWWEAVHGRKPPAEWHRYGVAVERGLHAADAIATPSAAMARALDVYADIRAGNTTGIDQSKFHVVHSGLDLEAIDAPGRRAPLVFAAGPLWDEAKNIRVLDRAARQLSWPVYVAGESVAPHGGEIEMTYVRPVGPLAHHEMQQWLARASIFALPALYEPFGLAVLEAALSGCALVLGDIPSLREIWGDAAVYVPPRDAEALARTLTRLIEDPQALELQRTRAFLQAARYSRAAMVSGYMDLYEALLSKRPHGGNAWQGMARVAMK